MVWWFCSDQDLIWYTLTCLTRCAVTSEALTAVRLIALSLKNRLRCMCMIWYKFGNTGKKRIVCMTSWNGPLSLLAVIAWLTSLGTVCSLPPSNNVHHREPVQVWYRYERSPKHLIDYNSFPFNFNMCPPKRGGFHSHNNHCSCSQVVQHSRHKTRVLQIVESMVEMTLQIHNHLSPKKHVCHTSTYSRLKVVSILSFRRESSGRLLGKWSLLGDQLQARPAWWETRRLSFANIHHISAFKFPLESRLLLIAKGGLKQ